MKKLTRWTCKLCGWTTDPRLSCRMGKHKRYTLVSKAKALHIKKQHEHEQHLLEVRSGPLAHTTRVTKKKVVEWRCPLCPHALVSNASTPNACAARKQHFAKYHPDDTTRGWRLGASWKLASLKVARLARSNAKAARTVLQVMKGTETRKDIHILLHPMTQRTRLLCRTCGKMAISAVQLDKSCERLWTSPDNGKQKQERVLMIDKVKQWAATAEGESREQAGRYVAVLDGLEVMRDQVAATVIGSSTEVHSLRAKEWRKRQASQQ